MKKDNHSSWMDAHRLLWPGCSVPDLLQPVQQNKKQENAYFVELTVPTSLLISALCARIVNRKVNPVHRGPASSVLSELVRVCASTGNLVVKVHIDYFDSPVDFPIKKSQFVPARVFIPGDEAKAIEEHWLQRAQDLFAEIQAAVNVGVLLQTFLGCRTGPIPGCAIGEKIFS